VAAADAARLMPVSLLFAGPAWPQINKVYIDFHFINPKIEVKLRLIEVPMDVFRKTWLDRLSEEERNFLKRFVLASGSLKALAEEYRVSYPTIRLRLDRLIEKVKIFDSDQITSEFERQLRALHAEGKIDLATLKQLLDAYRAEQQTKREAAS
jgi:hypothetical protein